MIGVARFMSSRVHTLTPVDRIGTVNAMLPCLEKYCFCYGKAGGHVHSLTH